MVGKPLIYSTSKHFMDYLGINSPSQLPYLKDITDKEIIFPTNGIDAVPLNNKPTLQVAEHEDLKQAS